MTQMGQNEHKAIDDVYKRLSFMGMISDVSVLTPKLPFPAISLLTAWGRKLNGRLGGNLINS